MSKLDKKIVLITGGSDGIGWATAQQFINEGVEHIYITGRRQHALDDAVKNLGSKKVTAVQGDVSNLADLDKLYDVIKKKSGDLDIIFANAAVTEAAALGTITEKHFDDHINVNVIKRTIIHYSESFTYPCHGASIILNASAASVKANAGASVYSATKAAVRSFARS